MFPMASVYAKIERFAGWIQISSLSKSAGLPALFVNKWDRNEKITGHDDKVMGFMGQMLTAICASNQHYINIINRNSSGNTHTPFTSKTAWVI
jgi:hypothetical protein